MHTKTEKAKGNTTVVNGGIGTWMTLYLTVMTNGMQTKAS